MKIAVTTTHADEGRGVLRQHGLEVLEADPLDVEQPADRRAGRRVVEGQQVRQEQEQEEQEQRQDEKQPGSRPAKGSTSHDVKRLPGCG